MHQRVQGGLLHKSYKRIPSVPNIERASNKPRFPFLNLKPCPLFINRIAAKIIATKFLKKLF